VCIVTGFAVSVGWIHTGSSSAIDHGCSGTTGRNVSISSTWDVRTEADRHCGRGWNTGNKVVQHTETMSMCVINYYIWLQWHLLSGCIMKMTVATSCNYSCTEENHRRLFHMSAKSVIYPWDFTVFWTSTAIRNTVNHILIYFTQVCFNIILLLSSCLPCDCQEIVHARIMLPLELWF